MGSPVSRSHPLRQLFGALTERASPNTSGGGSERYRVSSNLLVEFAHSDQLYKNPERSRAARSIRSSTCCLNRKCSWRRTRSNGSATCIGISETLPSSHDRAFPRIPSSAQGGPAASTTRMFLVDYVKTGQTLLRASGGVRQLRPGAGFALVQEVVGKF